MFDSRVRKNSALLRRPKSYRPELEMLESRAVPYAVSGNYWLHPELVTVSFMADGTYLKTYDLEAGGWQNSTLLSDFNARWPGGNWQQEFKRAAQVWAEQTNLNFFFVSDNGDAVNSGSYQQGSPYFGDIRIGGYGSNGNGALAFADEAQPATNMPVAGEEEFDTDHSWKIPGTSGTYDLFTVASHEVGHSLGLDHSTSTTAIMYATYNGVKSFPTSDDIAGIRAIYGGARQHDSYDTVSPANNSISTPTIITSQLDSNGVALITGRDITTRTDLDYYKVVAPSNTSSTLKVNVQSAKLSMLSPKLSIYNVNQVLLQSVSMAGQYSTTASLTISGVTAGATFYIKAEGAENSSFGTGAYALAVNFSTGTTPTAARPDTRTLNGDPPSYGETSEYSPDEPTADLPPGLLHAIGAVSETPIRIRAPGPAPANVSAARHSNFDVVDVIFGEAADDEHQEIGVLDSDDSDDEDEMRVWMID